MFLSVPTDFVASMSSGLPPGSLRYFYVVSFTNLLFLAIGLIPFTDPVYLPFGQTIVVPSLMHYLGSGASFSLYMGTVLVYSFTVAVGWSLVTFEVVSATIPIMSVWPLEIFLCTSIFVYNSLEGAEFAPQLCGFSWTMGPSSTFLLVQLALSGAVMSPTFALSGDFYRSLHVEMIPMCTSLVVATYK